MRNLKRALSLTLASVMLLGMMVVGTSAAGFPDVDVEDNVEAIEVLQAVKVMVGDANTGNFRPDSPVTRAEMAVVMANLLNLDYNYYASACPFTDVPTWARGSVGAAYANKIVSGRSATTYDPDAPVTAVEASSMLMRALGYFRYNNDYADGFVLSTVSQGTKIGIYENVGSSADAPMTRNQVAQMVLNALRTGMVEPDGNTINLTTPDGTVLTGKVNYVYVTNKSQSFANAISTAQASSMGSSNDSAIVELGEKLYNGDLKLYGEQNTLRPNVVDDFGRPARYWEYKGKEIGTYAKQEQLKAEYTTEVTGKMLYDLLGSSVVNDPAYKANMVVTIDGNTYGSGADNLFNMNSVTRTNDKGVGGTGNGVLTQVYDDTDQKIIRVAIINTYLAIANDDYNEKKDEVSLDVYSLENPSGDLYEKDKADLENGEDPIYTERIAAGEDFAITDVKKDDKFLVTVAEGEIKSMVEPEVLSDETITVHKVDKYVVAGQQYDYTTTVQYDAEVLESFSSNDMKDVTYNIVLDKYGYLIGLERNEDPDQYVFLTGIDDAYSHLSQKNVPANVIFLDGSMKTVTVNTKDSKLSYDPDGDPDTDNNVSAATIPSQANMWCTYSVDSDNVYTLKAVAGVVDGSARPKVKVAQSAMDATGGDIEIDTKNISLDGSGSLSRVHGTDATVYINTTELENVQVDSGAGNYYQIIDDVDSVTVGVSKVDLTVNEIDDVIVKGQTYVAPENEVYTLFKDNGTIIAVVTLNAEDSATTSHYAYINSSKIERRGITDDGKYWFEREAIVDGAFVMLREVSDDKASTFMDALDQGKWYEIKYNADDEVRGIIEVTYAADDSHAPSDLQTGDPKDPDPVATKQVGTPAFPGVQYSLNDGGWDKTLILQADFYDEDEDGGADDEVALKYDHNTLYVDNNFDEGIYVASDAKVIVFIDDYDDYKEFAGDQMKTALKFLNNSDAFSGYVNAVIDSNGIARVVVLDEKTSTVVNPMTVTVILETEAGAEIGRYTDSIGANKTYTAAAALTHESLSSDDYTATGVTSKTVSFVADGSETVRFTYKDNTANQLGFVFQFKDQAGTPNNLGSTTVGKVSPTNGLAVVNFKTNSSITAALAELNKGPDGIAGNADDTYWKIKDGQADAIVNAANQATTINITLDWETVNIKLADGSTDTVKVSQAADAAKGLSTAINKATINDTTGVNVLKGVNFTINSDNDGGNYNSEGTSLTNMKLTTDKVLADTDYGYYKVSMDGTTPIDGTVTNVITTGNKKYTATMAEPIYTKEAGTATVAITVSATGGNVTANTIKVTAADTEATADTLTPDGTSAATHGVVTADGDAVTFNVTVGWAAAPTSDITIKVTLST